MGERNEELPVGVFGDRRRSPRVPVTLRCEAVTDDDFFLLGDQIADLSTSGMLLRADGVPADVGEVVLISFQPPKSHLWIDARARIVRLLTGREKGAPGFGLHLEDLSPFEREVLASAVHRSAEPGSKRRRRRKRPNLRRARYVDPSAVAVRPLVRVSETRCASAPVPAPRPGAVAARVPRSTFADEGVIVVRPRRGEATPRSLWRSEPLPEARPVVVARPRPRPQRVPPVLGIRRTESQVVIARTPAPPAEPEVLLPPVATQRTVTVADAPSVIVVRAVATGTAAAEAPAVASGPDLAARVVVVGRTQATSCTSDWACAADR